MAIVMHDTRQMGGPGRRAQPALRPPALQVGLIPGLSREKPNMTRKKIFRPALETGQSLAPWG
jgi:hypothetical protein